MIYEYFRATRAHEATGNYRILFSFRLYFAMYEQENVRNNEPPNYSRLKSLVRRHMDQTMRARNFRARNEIVGGGAVTKSQKGRKVSVERKVGVCYQWKAIAQCSKGDSCSFIHDRASGNRCNRSLLHQKRRHRLTERNPQNVQVAEEKVFLEQKAELCADISLQESVRTRHVIIGTSRVSQLQG